MIRHSENALAVAKHLEKHPKVSWINYPGLPSSPEKKKADKYLPKGAGAIIGFGIKGGAEAGKGFAGPPAYVILGTGCESATTDRLRADTAGIDDSWSCYDELVTEELP